MTAPDQELLTRLKALGSKARKAAGAGTVAADVVGALGLPAADMTPAVRAALGLLIGEVADLREELNAREGRLVELERLADEDALAPVSNRRAFLRDLARTIGYVGRYRASCSLLYIDVNGLKVINDTYGHAAGDAALIHVAKVLMVNTRTSDIVGRLGGDEFGVLLARANPAHALANAERLTTAVHRTDFLWNGVKIPLSVACGVHSLSAGEDPQNALAAADRAMYARKRGTVPPA